MDGEWYAVRCVLLDRSHKAETEAGSDKSYEERITLWMAHTAEAAVRRAEQEAEEYGRDVGSDYVGLAQSFHLAETLQDGCEVFSLIRRSPLPENQYLSRYFDTGGERQQVVDPREG